MDGGAETGQARCPNRAGVRLPGSPHHFLKHVLVIRAWCRPAGAIQPGRRSMGSFRRFFCRQHITSSLGTLPVRSMCSIFLEQ